MERKRILVPEEVPKTATYLDEDLINKFCDLIKRGLPPDGACDYLSIGSTAYWNWIRKGQQFLDGNGNPLEYEMYGLFVQKFRQATAQYRLGQVDDLHTATGKEWIKHLAILERRDRKTFGRKAPEGGGDEAVDTDDRFL